MNRTILTDNLTLLFLLLVIISPGFADEEIPDILKILIRSSAIYEAEGRSACQLNPYFTFGAEVVQGHVRKAVLTVRSSLPFVKSELEGLRLYQDRHGGLWFQRFELSRRQMIWLTDAIRRERGWFEDPCGPSTSIKKINPDPVTLDFETELLGEGVYSSHSNEVSFRGTTIDYVDFKITMRLVQSK